MLSPPSAAKYVALSWAVFYTFAVLFGAPFFSDIVSTAVLSAVLTIVSVLPAVIISDTEENFLEIFILAFSGEETNKTKETVYLSTATFSVLGAWAAAAVHPLDWDRWWQRYPLPSLAGCIGGALLGALFGCIHVFIRKNKTISKSKKR